jgi:hypothetical protein
MQSAHCGSGLHADIGVQVMLVCSGHYTLYVVQGVGGQQAGSEHAPSQRQRAMLRLLGVLEEADGLRSREANMHQREAACNQQVGAAA